jgi:hypothetical protein
MSTEILERRTIAQTRAPKDGVELFSKQRRPILSPTRTKSGNGLHFCLIPDCGPGGVWQEYRTLQLVLYWKFKLRQCRNFSPHLQLAGLAPRSIIAILSKMNGYR